MANEPDAEPPKVENFEELMEQLSVRNVFLLEGNNKNNPNIE